MTSIKISALTTGVPHGTDETPATDTTDTTQAASGTTKKYIRSDELNFYLHAMGLTAYDAVRVATDLALTVTYVNGAAGVGATLTNAGAQAAIIIDGVTLALNDRVLVKNQASDLQNGIYTVTTLGTATTNWVLTRATDYDQPAEIIQYAVVVSNQGTVNANILWQETGAGPFVIGTTSITFTQFTTQSLTLPVSLAQGGTSASLTANNGGIFYSTASAGAILAGTATAQQMLQSGASTSPSWSTASWPTTTTINKILYSSANNVVSEITAANSAALVSNGTGVPSWQTMTAGQVLIGTTAAAPVAATISSGTGILVTNASGSITVSLSGVGSLIWSGVAGTTQAAAVNSGYIIQNAAQTTVTLPATAAIGSIVAIAGNGAAGWVMTANVGQTIKILTGTTSSGGSLTSTNQYDCVEVVCVVANTTWVARHSVSAGLTIA